MQLEIFERRNSTMPAPAIAGAHGGFGASDASCISISVPQTCNAAAMSVWRTRFLSVVVHGRYLMRHLKYFMRMMRLNAYRHEAVHRFR